jgi:hypothetical protein
MSAVELLLDRPVNLTKDNSSPFTPANARRVIDALVETAPVYAGFLPLEARDQIIYGGETPI